MPWIRHFFDQGERQGRGPKLSLGRNSMSKHRVARTGQPMLTFFGDLIARKHTENLTPDGLHLLTVSLFRTEAPGYVLSVSRQEGGVCHHWAAHTPRRLEVAGLFDRYIRDCLDQDGSVAIFEDARQEIMVQAPELDELVQWSSVVGSDSSR